MATLSEEPGPGTAAQVSAALDRALAKAELNFLSGVVPSYGLSLDLQLAVKDISDLSQKASTGFTNIVTCLAIKAALPHVDVRYHQVQIQAQTSRPANFNFRGLSERVVFPWLSRHNFEGAKSGWQTRTFERPKPYILTYDENIGVIKKPFLQVFHKIEDAGENAEETLSYLIHLQLIHRESSNITLAIPRTKDIQLIVNVFKSHFFHPYSASRGASRLPVLALYATYSVLLSQLDRYAGMELKALEQHSAADSQTGALGDIEVRHIESNTIYEAIEVKHNIPLDDAIIQDAARKIMDKSVDRYYILTTHAICEPDDELSQKITNIKSLYDCQLIANGVIPTLRYYLRLLSDPSLVFPKYVELLKTDDSIKHEHREVWNNLAVS